MEIRTSRGARAGKVSVLLVEKTLSFARNNIKKRKEVVEEEVILGIEKRPEVVSKSHRLK